ncbi:MAG: inorganic phosphate transporter [Saprospiraceae bacterium]|nr:inorganic phosphate transporter [Saprospiraceae bacterium]MBP7699118.1 inorganic phosphate transporter [Saprospiraceae bacterium]
MLSDLTPQLYTLLIICIFTVCIFEFINGFHDTANAVATVIYTKTLHPTFAVIWSGIFNALGAFTGVGVALSIINLLPIDILMTQGLYNNIAMVLAILTAAIIWNFGTWYIGIPSSSSHTLIGSMLGVGLVYSMLPDNLLGIGVNWAKAKEIGLALLVAPLIGFTFSITLMFILKSFVKDKKLFREPEEDARPPLWIRAILICTCTGVSYSHGSNDGQKGIALMIIVLMTFAPLEFALKSDFDPNKAAVAIEEIKHVLQGNISQNIATKELGKVTEAIDELEKDVRAFNPKNAEQLFNIRKRILFLQKQVKVFLDEPGIISNQADRAEIKSGIKQLQGYVNYSPWWVTALVALCLGIGTMIGWKRIVITIGEKIGKRHMTYAEGATAEIVAAGTISASSWLGLPVSTTHILSSGVAGSMVASKGIKNLQRGTIKNIALAWILTLPVTIVLSGVLYLLFRWIVTMI